jgi:tripartite-type tricarboxylate transporter receptor subunit TctC
MNMITKSLLACCAVAQSTCLAGAETVAEFYRGKTVNVIVAAPPGGGYDLLARTISRHLGPQIPGQPTIVVRNMAGAGGIVAMNYMYNTAPRDGTTIGAMQNNAPFEPLFGTKEALYDPTKFSWLGSPSTETALLAVWHTVPVTTYEDVRKHEIKVGSTGANSNTSLWARILIETLGLKLKTVVGYPGQNDILLGVERGELDGYPGVFYASLAANRPAWIADNKIKLLLQMGGEREASLPDVPLLSDVVTTPEDKQLAEQASAPMAIGRPYGLPPGVPADRVAALRDALWAVFQKPEFVEEAKKMQMDPNARRTGKQVQDIIERAYQAPAAVTERLRRLLNG